MTHSFTKPVPINILVPRNILSGYQATWDVLSADELQDVLAIPMPAVEEWNRSLTLEKVIERVTGKTLFWVPSCPPSRGVTGSVWTYADEIAVQDWRDATVGSVLRGILSTNTEVGEPRMRMFGVSSIDAAVQGSDANITARAKMQGSADMLDVAFVTKSHIVIVAVPAE